jgi:O-methyltransferase
MEFWDGGGTYVLLQGVFPDETAFLIPTREKFCFCHIDVDVYLSAKHIVDWLWDKLVVGGIIVFDDYGFDSCPGITKYVDEELALSTNTIFVHNLNGHAVIIKISQ